MCLTSAGQVKKDQSHPERQTFPPTLALIVQFKANRCKNDVGTVSRKEKIETAAPPQQPTRYLQQYKLIVEK